MPTIDNKKCCKKCEDWDNDCGRTCANYLCKCHSPTPEKKCECIACKNGMKTGHTVFNQFIENQKSMNHQPIFTPSWEVSFKEWYQSWPNKVDVEHIIGYVNRYVVPQLLKEEREKAYERGFQDSLKGLTVGKEVDAEKCSKFSHHAKSKPEAFMQGFQHARNNLQKQKSNILQALEDGKNNIK